MSVIVITATTFAEIKTELAHKLRETGSTPINAPVVRLTVSSEVNIHELKERLLDTSFYPNREFIVYSEYVADEQANTLYAVEKADRYATYVENELGRKLDGYYKCEANFTNALVRKKKAIDAINTGTIGADVKAQLKVITDEYTESILHLAEARNNLEHFHKGMVFMCKKLEDGIEAKHDAWLLHLKAVNKKNALYQRLIDCSDSTAEGIFLKLEKAQKRTTAFQADFEKLTV